jgi:hypothetical protein
MPRESTTALWYREPDEWYLEEQHEETECIEPFSNLSSRLLILNPGDKTRAIPTPNWRIGGAREKYRPRFADINTFGLALALQLTRKERELEHINSELEEKFQYLSERWSEETSHLSSITKRVLNTNYQRIIGMGPAVLPILFRELQQRPDYWFWALEAITGEDPTSPDDAGDIGKMTESWLEWAKRRGYLNVSPARILIQQSAEQQV